MFTQNPQFSSKCCSRITSNTPLPSLVRSPATGASYRPVAGVPCSDKPTP
ncbi:hypothetical protein Hanom_Chr07g00655141 [Helianthus anomalus]